MDEIVIRPVGIVRSETDDPNNMPLGGKIAVIEVFSLFTEALQGIEENSHIWVLAWFHKAERDWLKTVPLKVNPDLPEYGVFALRAFNRPNPVGMCLARLEKVEGNCLYVSGLDAIGGTPVIDIKPYYENDIIFSPQTPYIKGKIREMRQGFILKHALTHHQEDCRDLRLAVRMAVIAEEVLGKLNENNIIVEVQGTGCLADCIQGITRARFANPPRFSFKATDGMGETVWKKDDNILRITARDSFTFDDLLTKSDEELFDID
ncbi:MAG: tRNA (N6-threonylcarbamoyladenosine(37)-N6)-methyltransferase TrmO [Bacillota bacterium]|nr:tRNA (N6-threonylcarbamoyladenosine(37)-N6)-methyltransferase TrmO [Bacillota bacterium]